MRGITLRNGQKRPGKKQARLKNRCNVSNKANCFLFYRHFKNIPADDM